MYSDSDTFDSVGPDNFRSLLRTCFEITISNDGTKTCPLLERTIETVVLSCFFSKDALSPGFICRWLEQNCPRLVPPLYKYCIITITSAYRGLEAAETNKTGLELATPVLEKSSPFNADDPPLLPISEAWLIAGAIDPLYSRPQEVQNPNFVAKLLTVLPSHWTLLYDSNQHGVGSNRFLHHVTGYKGPSLVLIRGNDDKLFCICSPSEWKETHMYTGTEHCCIIQLSPK